MWKLIVEQNSSLISSQLRDVLFVDIFAYLLQFFSCCFLGIALIPR